MESILYLWLASIGRVSLFHLVHLIILTILFIFCFILKIDIPETVYVQSEIARSVSIYLLFCTFFITMGMILIGFL